MFRMAFWRNRLAERASVTSFLIMVAFTSAHAFKPKTHVWVAQQVLNDVADGCSERVGAQSCVTIVLCTNQVDGRAFPWTPGATCRPREYAVSPQIANALTRHPASYRAGSIGPDAFPDLVVGQSTAHPGREGGWRADDWMRWMLRHGEAGDQERAFAQGYLSHGASDVFAHSYVNTYTGGVFVLTDGETTVERRHIALEDFIDRFTPPITDGSGNPVSEGDLLAIPSSFLARRLVLDDAVNDEYQDLAKSSAPHLVAMYGVYRAVEEAEKLTKLPGLEWELLERLRKLEAEAKQLVIEVDGHVGPIAQAKLQVQAAKEGFAIHDQAIALQEQAVEQARNGLQQLITAESQARSFLAELPAKQAGLIDQLSNLRSQLQNVPREFERQITEEACKWAPFPLNEICEDVTKTVRDLNPAFGELERRIGDMDRQLADLAQRAITAQAEVDNFLHEKANREAVNATADLKLQELKLARLADKKAIEALEIAERRLRDLEEQKRQLFERLAKIQSGIDLMQGPLGGVRTIHELLRTWREDTAAATSAYLDAGLWAGQALVEHKNPLAAYSDWLSCWSPVFTGIPSPISRTACGVARDLQALSDLVSTTRKQARDLFGNTGGWIVDPLGKLEEEVQKKVKPAVARAAVDVVRWVAGPEMGAFASLLVEEFDEGRLNELFGEDESGKNLLLIPDIATRAKSDMVVAHDQFSPTDFAAASNAVVLAKLSLLDADELNRLAKDAGWWPPSHWGDTLYQQRPQFNILIGAIRSLDGDHQWNFNAPPNPRRNGTVDTTRIEDRQFGYKVPEGFRYWQSCKARELVFLGIFRGPLTPGIDDLLPPGYPYRPTPKDPFPKIQPDVSCDE